MVVMKPRKANCSSLSYPSHTDTSSPRLMGMELSPCQRTFFGSVTTHVSVSVSMSRVISTPATLSNRHVFALLISIFAVSRNIV